MKTFRFNPRLYKTTYRIVKSIHPFNCTLMNDGYIIIEYLNEQDILYLFSSLALHVPTDEDIETPLTPKEERKHLRSQRAYNSMRILQIVGVVSMIIYVIYLLVFGEPS